MSKLSLIELLLLRLEVGLSLLTGTAFAVIVPDQELKVLGYSIVGAILGGFCGAYFYSNANLKDWMLRWGVNIAAGVVTGLYITATYEEKYSNMPISFLALISAAVSGPLTVIAIPIGLPYLKRAFVNWCQNFFKNKQ